MSKGAGFIRAMMNAVSQGAPIEAPLMQAAMLADMAVQAKANNAARADMLSALAAKVAALPDMGDTGPHNCADYSDGDVWPCCQLCGAALF